jgi:hypothetical protein
VFEHTLDVDMSVSIISGMILQRKMIGLFVSTCMELGIRAHAFGCIFHQARPELYMHFKNLDLRIQTFCELWLPSLFCGFLEKEEACSAIDNFMLEGYTALYKVMLAKFDLLEYDLLTCEDPVSMLQTPTPRLFPFVCDLTLDYPEKDLEINYFCQKIRHRMHDEAQWTSLDHKYLPWLLARQMSQ